MWCLLKWEIPGPGRSSRRLQDRLEDFLQQLAEAPGAESLTRRPQKGEETIEKP